MNKRINFVYLFFAYSSLFCLGFIDNSRGPAYPRILETFNISTAQGALIFSLASLSGLITNITTRWWLGRIGVIGSIKLSMFLLFIGSLIFGGSYYLAPSLIVLYFSAIVTGTGLGFSAIGMNILIARGTHESLRRRAFSGLHSIYGIASLITPLALGFFQNHLGHWGHYFMVISLLPLIFFLIYPFIKVEEVQIDKSKPLTPPVGILSRISFGMVFGFYVCAEITVSSRIVLFLERSHNFSPENAKIYLTYFFLGLMLGRILFAILPSKGKSWKYLSGSIFSSLVIFYFGYHGYPGLICLTGASMSFFFPVGMDWLSGHFHKDVEYLTASAMSMTGVTLVIMHALFGTITKSYGTDVAFLMAPACLVISFIFLMISQKLASNHLKLRKLENK